MAAKALRCFEKPLASVVVQRSGQSTIGMQEEVLRESQYFVFTVDMSSFSYAVDPSSPPVPFPVFFG